MTRRIVWVALASATLAVALFAFPLAIAVQRLYVGEAQAALESTALRTAATIGPDFAGHDPAELPNANPGDELGLYDAAGRRISGSGPDRADAATRAALSGNAGQAQEAGSIVVAVPVSSAEQVIGAVRAATPTSVVWRRTATTWAWMVAAAALALAGAIVAASLLARRVNRPLQQLTEATRRVGDGDFAARMTPTGLREVDDAGDALNVTAARIGDLVDREQTIAANASHQLRTPLTGLRAALETALADPSADPADAMTVAIEAADRLEVTIGEIISLTRGTTQPADSLVVTPALDAVVARWGAPLADVGRPLRLRLEDPPGAVRFPEAALHQILDVLVDNALRHGVGTVSLVARHVGPAVALDVADEGSGIPADADIFQRGVSLQGGSGIGLALARALAEDNGGRLRLSQREPCTRFTLLLPPTENPPG